MPADAARKWIGDQIDRLPFVESIKKGAEAGMDKVNQRFRGKRDADSDGSSTDVAPGSAWESVQIARNVHRPTASSYIKVLSPSFLELHGDREFADDKAIVAGLGRINGRPVTIIAQEKGSTLPERIKRNFGCPMPKATARRLASCVRPRSSIGPSFAWSTPKARFAAWRLKSEVRVTR